MELNNALRHLSEEEIKEVIRMYHDTTIKLVDIIEKFNIKAKPSTFAKILPLVKCEDTCIFCGNNLMHKVQNRYDINRGSEIEDKFCPECGHHEYSGRRSTCNCDGCQKVKEEENQRKKELIRETYSIKREFRKLEDLEFEDQMKLVYVLIKNPLHNISNIAPIVVYTDDVDKDIYVEYLRRLVSTNIISVSPDSDINAFNEKNFPSTFWLDRVIYDVNIEFNEEFVLDPDPPEKKYSDPDDSAESFLEA